MQEVVGRLKFGGRDVVGHNGPAQGYLVVVNQLVQRHLREAVREGPVINTEAVKSIERIARGSYQSSGVIGAVEGTRRQGLNVRITHINGAKHPQHNTL